MRTRLGYRVQKTWLECIEHRIPNIFNRICASGCNTFRGSSTSNIRRKHFKGRGRFKVNRGSSDCILSLRGLQGKYGINRRPIGPANSYLLLAWQTSDGFSYSCHLPNGKCHISKPTHRFDGS